MMSGPITVTVEGSGDSARVLIWTQAAMYPVLELNIEDAEWLLSQLHGTLFDVRWAK